METEASALEHMLKFIKGTLPYAERWMAEKLLLAAMYALKTNVKDETTWHVFIQDFAASLNRAGLLSNTNVQLFREEAYVYMRAES